MIWKQSQEHIKIGQVVLSGPGGMGGTIMGVDICHNKGRKVHKEHKSQDIYPRLLIELDRFFGWMNSSFKQVMPKRLFMCEPTSASVPFQDNLEAEAS